MKQKLNSIISQLCTFGASLFIFSHSAWAQGGGAPPEQPGVFGMLVPFLLMFGVIYFLMVRPQQKKMKEHQELIKSLKSGDQVVTNSGIIGQVADLTDKVATVEVAEKVKIRVLRNQIAQVLKEGEL